MPRRISSGSWSETVLPSSTRPMRVMAAEANRTLVLLAAAAVAMGLAAALILTGHRVLAGVAALVGGVAMVAGGLVVRAGPAAPRVVFADLMLDRLLDAAVLAPLAWVAR